MDLDRRTLLRAAAVTALSGGASAALGGSLWRAAAAPGLATPGPGRYGPLQPADASGLELPAGFTSRVVARSGQPVGATGTWHPAPDGGACFARADGGWVYVSNSEVAPDGGVGALHLSPRGEVLGALRLLSGTRRNCAGGATPWSTWLSCEEVEGGLVWEVFPLSDAPAVVRPAMGAFTHEAVAVDPDRRVVYLTEDQPDGCLYRFVPDRWPDLATGVLEVLVAGGWARVPDPSARRTRTRYQVAGALRFAGGEGCCYRDGVCFFTTKGDGRVWRLRTSDASVSVLYDDAVDGAPLTGVDNVTASGAGELFVAEDGGDMQICVISPGGRVSPFLRVAGHPRSEVTGPAFSPDGRRLYFSSQRGASGTVGGGVTYEVTGPFRPRRPALPGPFR